MNENGGRRVEAQTVSMYPQDWAVVRQVAKDLGQSVSGGLRIIVREYVQLKTAELQEARRDC